MKNVGNAFGWAAKPNQSLITLKDYLVFFEPVVASMMVRLMPTKGCDSVKWPTDRNHAHTHAPARLAGANV